MSHWQNQQRIIGSAVACVHEHAVAAARVWPYSIGMAIPNIKSTYSLDVESVRVLEALAKRWKVSKSEVLRRAIRIAAHGDYPEKRTTLEALDQLQSSVRERRIDLEKWARDVKAERQATDLRRPDKPR